MSGIPGKNLYVDLYWVSPYSGGQNVFREIE